MVDTPIHPHRTETEPDEIRLFEVGPRDGLQNESALLEVDQKLELIDRLVGAGVRDIEIGSFVHPEWVPQMADTDEVARRVLSSERAPEVRWWALVPNETGLERALDAGVSHVATFVSASESHNQKNVNRSVEESLAQLDEVFRTARSEGCTIRAYVSTAFGCPFEGDVDFERVLAIAGRLFESGAEMISLGDTVGAGTPHQVKAGCRRALEEFGPENVALHMHDTQGFGMANVVAAWEAGVQIFDASVGATGGCPYAPGAAGNVATEEMLRFFESVGLDVGVELDEVLGVSRWLDESTPIEISSDLYRYLRETESDDGAACVA